MPTDFEIGDSAQRSPNRFPRLKAALSPARPWPLPGLLVDHMWAARPLRPIRLSQASIRQSCQTTILLSLRHRDQQLFIKNPHSIYRRRLYYET
jgi:hypothetical protein